MIKTHSHLNKYRKKAFNKIQFIIKILSKLEREFLQCDEGHL